MAGNDNTEDYHSHDNELDLGFGDGDGYNGRLSWSDEWKFLPRVADGRYAVPMGGDEKQHSGSKKKGAKDESNKNLPSAAAGLGMRLFIGANGSSGRIIQQSRALPACQPAF